MLTSPQFHRLSVQALSGLFRKHLFPLNRWQTICWALNTDSDSVMVMAAALLIPKSKSHSLDHLNANWLWIKQGCGKDIVLKPNPEIHANVCLQLAKLKFAWRRYFCPFGLCSCIEKMFIFILLDHEIQAEQLKGGNVSIARWEDAQGFSRRNAACHY